MENDLKIILKWNWRSPGVASSTAVSSRSPGGSSDGNAPEHFTSWTFSASWKLNKKMNENLQGSVFFTFSFSF